MYDVFGVALHWVEPGITDSADINYSCRQLGSPLRPANTHPHLIADDPLYGFAL